VRNYVSAILTKLQVSDRTQAAVMALRYGLVDLSDV
jgi:DNA-binding NarL/FixJ family response regulator